MKKPLLRKIAPFLGFALFGLALWVLHRALREYSLEEIGRLLRDFPKSRLVPAFLVTAISYLTLTLYDALAFRFIGRVLAWKRVAFASFLGYVFSHNMGLSLLSGGSVRYRLYSAWGVKGGEISLIVLFCGITFWLGLCFVGSIVLLSDPPPLPRIEGLGVSSSATLGLICLSLVVACTLGVLLRRKPLRLGKWFIPVPSPGLYGTQMALSAADWMLAGAVLFVLLPSAPGLTFPMFLGAFMLAQISGMLLHVPGGLGVFEFVMTELLAPVLPRDQLVAGLLAYRVVYYLVPFAIAIAMLAIYEIGERRAGMRRIAERIVHPPGPAPDAAAGAAPADSRPGHPDHSPALPHEASHDRPPSTDRPPQAEAAAQQEEGAAIERARRRAPDGAAGAAGTAGRDRP